MYASQTYILGLVFTFLFSVDTYAKDLSQEALTHACNQSVSRKETKVCCQVEGEIFRDTKSCCMAQRTWGRENKIVTGEHVDDTKCEAFDTIVCCHNTDWGFHFNLKSSCSGVNVRIIDDRATCYKDALIVCCETQVDQFKYKTKGECRRNNGLERTDRSKCNSNSKTKSMDMPNSPAVN